MLEAVSLEPIQGCVNGPFTEPWAREVGTCFILASQSLPGVHCPILPPSLHRDVDI